MPGRLIRYATIVLLFDALLIPSGVRSQHKPPIRKQQTAFGSETPVRTPVRLPDEILNSLVEENRDALMQCLQTDGGEQSSLKEYFTASAIDMNGDHEQDMVVQAGKYCLQGAHNTAFWIFTKGDEEYGKYELIFSRHTDWLEILPSSTNNYRDVQEVGHTAVKLFTTVWKFDGEKYRPRDCKIEDLQTRRVVQVKCSQS